MTKSTITRERIQQIFLGNGPELSASEERELARMTLVAMDSEPVAYIFKHPAGRLFWSLTDESNKGHDDVMPVYASPQPAPEEWTIADAVKFCKETGRQDAGAAMDAWNACRAAMLAAAPQLPDSDPATVPGKWIPVSERMPDVGDIVLTAMGGSVNVGEMERSGANYRYFTSVISGRELPVTHWMPLPAAPQEAINALIPLVSRNEQEVK